MPGLDGGLLHQRLVAVIAAFIIVGQVLMAMLVGIAALVVLVGAAVIVELNVDRSAQH